MDYALEVQRILKDYPGIFQVEGLKRGLLEESFAALSDTGRLMEPGQLSPLLGKLQQIKQKYSAAYYHAHQTYVGDAVSWERLTDLTQGRDLYQPAAAQAYCPGEQVALTKRKRYHRPEHPALPRF